MNSNTTTLWKLLESKMSVPLIQRDYAQGRKGKEHIRRLFLKEIKDCLCRNEHHGNNKKTLTLDFVYGNSENGKFYPIDGQQRLTTLWLLHWYLALKTGELSKAETRRRLKNFSYETRVSSRDFCEKLCEINIDAANEDKLSDYIQKQNWFYSVWLQDPTINAMLRTISGDNGFVDDNIQGVFNDINNFNTYWKLLTEEGVITFELMNIGADQLPVSDDLYIKMNARGKSLTDFENFKADLVGKINKLFEADESKKLYFTLKLDNDWTDLFWDATKENLGESFAGRIDEVYFEFINRFMLNRICLNLLKQNISPTHFRKDERKKDKAALEKAEKAFFSFDFIYENRRYEDFKVYQEHFTADALFALDRITTTCKDKNYEVLNIINSTLKNIENPDTEDENNVKQSERYCFIPQYSIMNKADKLVLNSTGLKERVYFHSICIYLETCGEFDIEKFKKWMRVCRNLIENADIDAVPPMVACLNLINDLATKAKNKSWDVYEGLQDFEDYPNTLRPRLNEQFNEEKEKAKIIISDQSRESTIIDAENYAFFNGAIRFLYQNEKGVPEWADFDKKWNNAKELFRNNTVETETLVKFLKLCEDFNGSFRFSTYGYHNRHFCWKTGILCKSDYTGVVHALLMKDSEKYQGEYKDFVDSGFIEKICEEYENYKYHYQWYSGSFAIHKERASRSEYCMYVSKERIDKNKILIDSKDIVIDNIQKNSFIWGAEITFRYTKNSQEYRFIWLWAWNDDEKGYKDQVFMLDKNGEKTEKFFIWENADKDVFFSQLDQLITSHRMSLETKSN